VDPSSAPWRALETTEDPAPRVAVPEPHGPPWAVVGATLAAVVLAVAAILVVARPSGDVVTRGGNSLDAGAIGQGGTSSAGPASGRVRIVVEVAGAVRRPGVYELPDGARVGDAIDAAGGFAGSVDAAAADRALNLAAKVRDGEEIRVPARGETVAPATAGGSAGPESSAGGSGDGGLVDVNRATADELDTLPGVGPATAAKIIAAREEQPFASVDDLLARRVVGSATLEKLRPLVTAGP
jgi:competence protein ComEA